MESKSEVIINDICNYCEDKHIKELLQEYMKRLILNKPQDPVNFLIKSINENPYHHPSEEQA